MLTAPIAKALLEIKQSAFVIIWDYQFYFEIAIDGKEIAPQRMTTPPEARKFKTLAAAYSYLRNFLDYQGDVSLKIAHDPNSGTGTSCVQTLHSTPDF